MTPDEVHVTLALSEYRFINILECDFIESTHCHADLIITL